MDEFVGRRFSDSELRDLKKLFVSLAYQSRSQGEYIIASVFQVLKFDLTLIRGVHIIICWIIGMRFGFMIQSGLSLHEHLYPYGKIHPVVHSIHEKNV